MAGESIITVVGNLTADPELRFTPSGVAVSNFTIAATPRHFDRQANEWKDGETLFHRCTVWREQAENIAESLTKGARVIAQGRLEARSFDDKEGNRRTAWELQVDDVGPALRFATANVTRQGRGGAPPQDQSATPAASGGSWSDFYGQQGAIPAQQTSPGGWGGSPSGAEGWGSWQ